ncbi:hypothetical protein [uncultured Roseibium sp.]|uniref:hypothetical protein n=1 Tax=uncultured Roseibium sp. TaxID=1936171 RepID=UPI0026055E00|nr:hypothetical protein [uncultured Roseibium sp.]
MHGAKLIRCLLAVSTFLFLTGNAHAVEIERAEFVVGIAEGDFEPVYYRADKVPLLPDRACFGWRIKIAGDETLIHTKEILTLPEQPVYWSGEDDAYDTSRISEDRTTAITEEYRAVKDGWVENYWCVSEGDPTGECSIEVFFGDLQAGRFDFQIISVN